jgi:PIN domain nuclease of toxin-antitoxin system
MGGFARLKFLLDTHIWLWTLHAPSKIGVRTHRQLRDPANELWLSPISTWEALTLYRRGKIEIQDTVTAWLERATAGTQEAPLTHEISLAASQIAMHEDPADRFLVATAQVLDLTLVTADERLLGLGTIRTLANR